MGEFVNISSFIIQLINISIIIFVLNKFLFKPFLVYIKEEDKKRIELEHTFNNLKEVKEKAQAEASAVIEGAKKEALLQKEKIEEFANKEKERIINESVLEGKSIVKYANEEAEKTKVSMLQSVRENILDLALRLNSKVFGKEATNRDFLERELEILNK